ncbi:ammonium transporter [Roseibium hamelinense]|uniref:Ammonium transporter n=1 Tax=Roseibium hamelinense TaxID=150831 RepID=A0A562SKQ6_9HYPH|nr:ammonium transporter [Roseibium hamelinense]MTI43408.1 ammonium transporter [Roseibium hamelinense]TWI81865.1 ammonium transporter [Roseibium hamelinense]
MNKFVARGAASLGAFGLMVMPALAQDAEAVPVSPEVAYIFNTLLFLIGGFLVMWMAAGFAMLEAGLVRSKNVSMQCLKNISLYSIAGLMYWITGYNLMYSGVDGGFIGSFGPYAFDAVGGDALDTGYSTASDWFFQMVFVATAASIVSGTVAERIKLWPFLLFVVVLTGFIYPIAGSWQWGGGWLAEMGFSDFAGSTLVHSVGGWAALTGAIILGARKGKYAADGSVHPLPGSSMPLATLGTFILWLGWFGFNGASQLAMGSIGDVTDISRIFANTNLAAASGVVAAVILTQVMYKKVDVTMALNGALAGLVAITAEPLAPSVWQTVFIGAVGGAIVVFTVPLLDKLKIDDVVGAIPVHLFAGIWGTLIVPLSNDGASWGTQITGIVAYGVFTVVASAVVWFILKAAIGIRVSDEEEALGLDKVEVGVEAYPEFGTGSQRM